MLFRSRFRRPAFPLCPRSPPRPVPSFPRPPPKKSTNFGRAGPDLCMYYVLVGPLDAAAPSRTQRRPLERAVRGWAAPRGARGAALAARAPSWGHSQLAPGGWGSFEALPPARRPSSTPPTPPDPRRRLPLLPPPLPALHPLQYPCPGGLRDVGRVALAPRALSERATTPTPDPRPLPRPSVLSPRPEPPPTRKSPLPPPTRLCAAAVKRTSPTPPPPNPRSPLLRSPAPAGSARRRRPSRRCGRCSPAAPPPPTTAGAAAPPTPASASRSPPTPPRPPPSPPAPPPQATATAGTATRRRWATAQRSKAPQPRRRPAAAEAPPPPPHPPGREARPGGPACPGWASGWAGSGRSPSPPSTHTVATVPPRLCVFLPALCLIGLSLSQDSSLPGLPRAEALPASPRAYACGRAACPASRDTACPARRSKFIGLGPPSREPMSGPGQQGCRIARAGLGRILDVAWGLPVVGSLGLRGVRTSGAMGCPGARPIMLSKTHGPRAWHIHKIKLKSYVSVFYSLQGGLVLTL